MLTLPLKYADVIIRQLPRWMLLHSSSNIKHNIIKLSSWFPELASRNTFCATVCLFSSTFFEKNKLQILIFPKGLEGGGGAVKENVQYVFFCVLRQVVCAAAGCVGPERGGQGDSSQQPAVWCSHLSCTVLGLPLAGPAWMSGCTGLYTNSCYRGARQVERYAYTETHTHI